MKLRQDEKHANVSRASMQLCTKALRDAAVRLVNAIDSRQLILQTRLLIQARLQNRFLGQRSTALLQQHLKSLIPDSFQKNMRHQLSCYQMCCAQIIIDHDRPC